MKKSLTCLLAISLVLSLIALSGCATMKGKEAETAMAEEQTALEPVLLAATPEVAMDKKSSVVLMGTGFEPGKQVVLLITDANGVLTDIGYALKPVPKADDTGTWATTWNAGRFVSKKLVKKGACGITAADDDYNPIAETAVYFFAKPKKDEK